MIDRVFAFRNKPYKIIGVAGDVRSFGLDIELGPMVYAPAAARATWNPMQLVVRTHAESARLPRSKFCEKIALPLEVFAPFYALVDGRSQNLPPPYLSHLRFDYETGLYVDAPPELAGLEAHMHVC